MTSKQLTKNKVTDTFHSARLRDSKWFLVVLVWSRMLGTGVSAYLDVIRWDSIPHKH